ncbi:MAG: choice-of-anchor B family protein [Chitinophagales bacterium]
MAQSEMQKLGQLEYEMGLNDVWGYADESGKEYAFVGTIHGLSIVDVSEPTTPDELFFIEGLTSTWRDIKTWEHYAYVVNEKGGGILIIDLSQLPTAIDTVSYDADGYVYKAHNIWIDEFGFAYAAGFNKVDTSIPTAERGVAIIDLNDNPMQPNLVHLYQEDYSHDVYVKDNLMFTSEIYKGEFAIIDVANKTNPILLARQNTPSNFTHNAWLSNDGNTLFTTDERSNGSVSSYNISDFSDIKLLDSFRAERGTGLIPHNVHVKNNFVVVSNYTAGVLVLDATETDALTLTEYYDTSFESGGGFKGCWGAYPFLPSGNILASDRQNGLIIVAPNYSRAAYVEGNVRNTITDEYISNTSIYLSEGNSNEMSDFVGHYKLGTGTPATYNVHFYKYAYEPYVVENVDLVAENIATVDGFLAPLPNFELKITVRDAVSQINLSDAIVHIEHSQGNYDFKTNLEGKVSQNELYEDYYDIVVTKWGYLPMQTNDIWFDAAENEWIVELERGYYDDFYSDLGWKINNEPDSLTVGFVREKPYSTRVNNELCNPASDVADDIGNLCYVTGNTDENTGYDEFDLDGGKSILQSPSIDLSNYSNPKIEFSWWFCAIGESESSDNLKVYIDNGLSKALVFSVQADEVSAGVWQDFSLNPTDFLPTSNDMFVSFEANNTSDNVVFEVAIDAFQIKNEEELGTPFIDEPAFSLQASPNPFSEETMIIMSYVTSDFLEEKLMCNIFDVNGRVVGRRSLIEGRNLAFIGKDLPIGIYMIQVGNNNIGYRYLKVIKSQY